MIRLSRRSTLFALAVALAPGVALGAPLVPKGAAPSLPQEQKLVFKIMRKGSPIGLYTIDIATTGRLTTVDVTTNIKVTVLFLTAYQLSQKGQEIWNGDQFVSYKGKTDDNGKKHVVSIAAGPKNTTIIANGKLSIAPKGAIPASLWNAGFLDQSLLIDPANGRQIPVKVVDMGKQSVVVQGVKETARHYHIHGLKRDVWMVKGEPVRFQIIGSDNSTVVSTLQPSG